MRFIVLASLLLCTSTAFAQEKNPKSISVVSTTIFPFHYLDEGKPSGIFIELAQIIFNQMGVEATFTIVDDKNALNLVKNGEYDATLSVSYSPDREGFLVYPAGFSEGKNFVWLSEYYFFSTKANKDAYQTTNLGELKRNNPKVGVIPGLSYAPEFWEADFTTVAGPDDETQFGRLIAGEIDLFISDKTIGRSILVRDGMEKDIVQLPLMLFSKPYTICLSKNSGLDNPEAILDAFFKQYDILKRSQVARKIFFKYLQS